MIILHKTSILLLSNKKPFGPSKALGLCFTLLKKINSGWNCEYKIYASDSAQKILIEFQHFSMLGCDTQNMTIIDDKTGRSGNHSNFVIDRQ